LCLLDLEDEPPHLFGKTRFGRGILVNFYSCDHTVVLREADMAKAIRMYKTGGPEVMVWEDYDPGRPGPGEALIRHEAAGASILLMCITAQAFIL